jgi:hypothetical protein
MINPTIKRASRLFLWLITIAISACTTIEPYAPTCEQKYNDAPLVAACLKKSINRDSNFKIEPNKNLAKKYIDYANEIVTQVEKKKISNAHARSLLSTEYTKLKSQVQPTIKKNKYYNQYREPTQKAYSTPSYNMMNTGDIDEPEKPGPK